MLFHDFKTRNVNRRNFSKMHVGKRNVIKAYTYLSGIGFLSVNEVRYLNVMGVPQKKWLTPYFNVTVLFV
jgi:hypothetical protein